VDEEPGIRANTTILLGNLASHLSEAACKRVLLNAFTRALKDTFPPARLAGVKVSGSTASCAAARQETCAFQAKRFASPGSPLVVLSVQHEHTVIKCVWQAMLATAQRHSPEELALRGVPALAPLAVDPVPEVQQALVSACALHVRIGMMRTCVLGDAQS
jgi:SCY1-like protein 1